MADTVNAVEIPEPILYAARREAPLEGITPEEWIERNFVFNPNAEQEHEAFWREWNARHPKPATGTLRDLLAQLPNRPSESGD